MKCANSVCGMAAHVPGASSSSTQASRPGRGAHGLPTSSHGNASPRRVTASAAGPASVRSSSSSPSKASVSGKRRRRFCGRAAGFSRSSGGAVVRSFWQARCPPAGIAETQALSCAWTPGELQSSGVRTSIVRGPPAGGVKTTETISESMGSANPAVLTQPSPLSSTQSPGPANGRSMLATSARNGWMAGGITLQAASAGSTLKSPHAAATIRRVGSLRTDDRYHIRFSPVNDHRRLSVFVRFMPCRLIGYGE